MKKDNDFTIILLDFINYWGKNYLAEDKAVNCENELGIYSHSTVLSPKGRTSKYHIWDLECQHRNFEGTLTFNVGMPVYVWISIHVFI